ncbi:hypothetical protein AGMMS49940_15290 [Spirochaetia bacterium]|nr:hypothetical protein AGMMS49940_15290 [Spirochaetia bacterium]
MEFGYCLDCNELNYAIPTQNGVFGRDNMSNNHTGHRQMVFDKPAKYTPPIKNVLVKLQSNQPISHNEIVIFKLAMDFDGIIDRELHNWEKREVKKETPAKIRKPRNVLIEKPAQPELFSEEV